MAYIQVCLASGPLTSTEFNCDPVLKSFCGKGWDQCIIFVDTSKCSEYSLFATGTNIQNVLNYFANKTKI